MRAAQSPPDRAVIGLRASMVRPEVRRVEPGRLGQA
jgi:hypothetical protein